MRKAVTLAAAILALGTVVALGQPVTPPAAPAATTVVVAAPTAVQVPLGAWIEAIAPTVYALILAVATYAMRALPASVVGVLRTMRAEQLLQRAIDYGVNTTAAAAKDKVITIPVANAVVAKALQYAVDNGAPAVVSWMGGSERIRDKLIARLQIQPFDAVVPQAIPLPVEPAK